MNANKNGTTSSLPQATPAGLPWKWKMRDPKNYVKTDFWKANNQAGIDLVNKQNELDTLSKAEKAQRLAGAYNPTPPPTVATAQNPVIKKTMDKPQEQTVTPAAIQGADINTLNSTLDELKYKVNVEGKQLTKEEYMTFESARRQLQDMMKPKEYTWFENVINDTKNLIETTKKEESASNAEELARYTESQDKRKESQLAILNEQEMTSKKRLASILWWSGQWQSTDTGEQFKALEDSFTLRKQEKVNEMQDRIDLYGATLRKDSKETIQALEKRLADQQMKVVDIDLKNLDIINAYNEKQWLSQLEKIDKLQQMAADIIANNTPLTDQQKTDAAMRSNKIIKPDWTFDRELWEILKKQNPMIAAEAVRQSTAIQNERIQSELAMKWLDADIKRAQLNKLLNPAKEYEFIKDADWNTVAIDKENPSVQIKIWGAMTWWLWDMRNLASQFPWQARAKNNNPAGITWNANFDNPKPWTTAYALQQAGVSFEKGTPRPWNEGWNYVTFPTMEDWLAAQRIMMTQTYGNTTVWNMLAKRVWTGEWPRYAQQVAGMAGVDVNARVNQLSDQQLQTLQMAKIQKESPWLAKILQQQTTSEQPIEWNFPQYASYIESGKLPVGMKDWTSKAETFKKQALEWYIAWKEQELNGLWLTIANPQAFASTATNTPKMKAINDALSVVPAFTNTMDQLIALTDKYWTELIPWNAKNQMSMLVKDAQLQAKEIYNLWVLNWPDLSLMESIIANPADWTAKWQQLFGVSFKKSLENAKAKIMDNAIEKAKSIWLAPIWTQTQNTANSDPLWLWI